MRSRIGIRAPLAWRGLLVCGLVGVVCLGLASAAVAQCADYGNFPKITSTYPGVSLTEMTALDDHHIVGLQGGEIRILGGSSLPDYETMVPLVVYAGGTLKNLAIVGSLAYCMNGSTCYAADLSDPDHPVLLGTATVPGSPLSLWGGAGVLGAMINSTTWQLYDCTNSLAPTVLSTTTGLTSSGSRIVIRGNRALVTGSGWRLYDISDPAAPVSLGSQDYPFFYDGYYMTTSTSVRNAELVGDRMVLLLEYVEKYQDNMFGTSYDRTYSLNVLDCTNPAAPVLLGNQTIGKSNAFPPSAVALADLHVNGNLALAYGGGDCVAYVYDISGASPTRLAAVNAGAKRGLFVAPGKIMMAITGGSWVFGYPQPATDNVMLTSWPAYSLYQSDYGTSIVAGDGWIAAQRTYSDPSGYYDYVDVYGPDGTALSSTPDRSGYSRADGTRLYAISSGYLSMMDMADPVHPAAPQTVRLGASGGCIGCGPDRRAAVGSNAGIQLYDLTDFAVPVLLGSVPGVLANDLRWIGNRVCAGTNTGVTAVDVSDPAAPVVLGKAAVGQCTWLRESPETGTIIAGGTNLVAKLDVTGASAPVVLGTISIPGSIKGAAVAGTVLYVSNGGVFAFSLANFAAQGQFVTGGATGMLVACGGALFGYGPTDGAKLYMLPQACDQGPVAAYDFRVTAQGGAAVVSWRADAPASEFRLEARRGEESWTLPVRADGDLLTATEDPARCAAGGTFVYTLSARAGATWTVIARQTITLDVAPAVLRLAGAAPNPFNPRTTVSFSLDRARPVALAVYDLRGRRVRELATGLWPAGQHAVTWDGLDTSGQPAASGTYLLRLKTDDGRVVGAAKMMLAR